MAQAQTTNTGRKTRVIVFQIIALLVFCSILIVIASSLNVFDKPSESHRVTFQLKASGGNARMSYTVSDGKMSESEVVSTPWKKTLTFRTGDEVYLVAGNPTGYGDIHCQIFLDGKLWREDSADYPNDKVACAGYVGSFSGK